MHTPYTTNFADAYEIAQFSIGALTSAVLWSQRTRPLVSRLVMQAAIGLAVVAPWLTEFELGLGFHPLPTHFVAALRVAALLGTLAALFAGSLGATLLAFVGEAVLYWVAGYLTESNVELASLHVAWLGLLVGLHRGRGASDAQSKEADAALDRRYPSDWVLAALATALAALVGSVVLQRMIGSSDEWAYTYQASVFAKFHAYALEPNCSPAFQNYWVFPYMGKLFAQYTPGWPYFMVPFVWLGVPWLAGSFSFGLFVLGAMRLARRAMSLAADATTREVRAAGLWAAGLAMASSTFLINGGSRFPHIFVLAGFVWALEALMRLTGRTRDPNARNWGIVLGVCCALLLATRPVDGAGLGVGLFLTFVYGLVRGRVAPKTLVAIALPFVLLSALTLVILRLQLGKWFTTGYSLATMIHPWAKYELVTPKPNEWRWGFPLATGSYGWFPCTLAVGLAGLASLGKRGRALNTTFFCSLAPVIGFYAFINLGRGYDWGYGPRYQMVAMVPMVIGSGVAMARLHAAATRRWTLDGSALASAAPFGAVVAVVIIGVVRLAPLVYPFNYTMVQNENRLSLAIHEAHLHHALVLAPPHTGAVDSEDLTKNLPLDLYPDQDVLVAVSKTPSLDQCVQRSYPDRALYRATGSQVVRLTRER